MRKDYIVAGTIILTFGLFFWWLVASSFFDSDVENIRDFTTDKCALLSNTSFEECCVAHDKAYWKGGTAKERLQSDKELQKCIEQKTNSVLKSFLIYNIVRIGGTPYFAVPWRWGYGWKFGRGYR
jgi:hypothetical protein